MFGWMQVDSSLKLAEEKERREKLIKRKLAFMKVKKVSFLNEFLLFVGFVLPVFVFYNPQKIEGIKKGFAALQDHI